LTLPRLCRSLLLLTLLALAWPVAAQEAGTPESSTQTEIAYLIDFVRGSDCIFLRNGDSYDGAAAAEHIVDKYDYLRDEIHTAEDFIERTATRSVLSGRAYQITCPDAAPVLAGDWLRAALDTYRIDHAPKNAP
jgi:hypothetical protein